MHVCLSRECVRGRENTGSLACVQLWAMLPETLQGCFLMTHVPSPPTAL